MHFCRVPAPRALALAPVAVPARAAPPARPGRRGRRVRRRVGHDLAPERGARQLGAGLRALRRRARLLALPTA